jgi:ABC-type multidrug transport system fused ATPase/permease subunit
MLERFYDPLSGTVELDGVDIKEINVTHLRSHIGYVGQEAALFATSIRGNIKYGNQGATQEQIEEAAKLANAHDFIMSFSDGYDTQVGDKGSQLSGGQKQRISIARVLVGNPRVLGTFLL